MLLGTSPGTHCPQPHRPAWQLGVTPSPQGQPGSLLLLLLSPPHSAESVPFLRGFLLILSNTVGISPSPHPPGQVVRHRATHSRTSAQKLLTELGARGTPQLSLQEHKPLKAMATMQGPLREKLLWGDPGWAPRSIAAPCKKSSSQTAPCGCGNSHTQVLSSRCAASSQDTLS